LLSWKRFTIFEDIIKFWLVQPEVDEVIVFDNSGKFKTELPVIVINSHKNFGAGVRMNIASLAKNDKIIYCDDDTMPKQGILEDFGKYIDEFGFVGTCGKIYNNYDYFDNKAVWGKDV